MILPISIHPYVGSVFLIGRILDGGGDGDPNFQRRIAEIVMSMVLHIPMSHVKFKKWPTLHVIFVCLMTCNLIRGDVKISNSCSRLQTAAGKVAAVCSRFSVFKLFFCSYYLFIHLDMQISSYQNNMYQYLIFHNGLN